MDTDPDGLTRIGAQGRQLDTHDCGTTLRQEEQGQTIRENKQSSCQGREVLRRSGMMGV